ncbi:hypothetical protein OAM37_00610 [bacterium]|nr:hypothetical protein [Pseudomonadales bacterium]MDB4639264.1 hypothetical protein [bacterium]MDC0317003.1 hypothetical protein [bacterium]MDG2014434.1 hypothetical protein [Pirellulaceae bacterium]
MIPDSIPSDEPDPATESLPDAASFWRFTQFFCLAIILISVISCIAIAVNRSTGLTNITITALDKDAEPRDHDIPFLKQKEALPDYQISLHTIDQAWIDLGVKPNESAIDGLSWQLPDPISTAEIISVRLTEQDKMIPDSVAEVQLTGNTITNGNYKFTFTTERSFAVGVRSFFKTPIGIAILVAFGIAALVFMIRSGLIS